MTIKDYIYQNMLKDVDEQNFAEFIDEIVSNSEIKSVPPSFNSKQELVLTNLLCVYLIEVYPEVMERLPIVKETEELIVNSVKIQGKSKFITFFKDNRDPLFTHDIIGSWLQHSLDNDVRKILAMNFSVGVHEMLERNLSSESAVDVVDPFCGSGRLITEVLSLIPVKSIRINDINPTSVLLAVCRILTVDEKVSIHATIGDAFREVLGDYDLVISNPPFTRSSRITNFDEISKRLNLRKIGHEGLHIYSILLLHSIVREKGQIISVLPGSTISSTYSSKVHSLLLSEYSQIKIMQHENELSLSENSEFNEILLFCKKLTGDKQVTFDGKNGIQNISHTTLKKEWNWMRFFRGSQLNRLRDKLLDELQLVPAGDLGLKIIRGIELYGPDFFFFPNRIHAEFTLTEDTLVLDDGCSIPLEYTELILRQPRLYKKSICPSISERVLLVPEIYVENTRLHLLESYVAKHADQSSIARKRYGDLFLHHTINQVRKKQPQGQIFLIDKLDLGSVSSLCFYTPKPMIATKNFYIINNRSKILAAWMNSSIYFLLYLSSRREINNTYGRLQIVDYFKEPLFPQSLFSLDISFKGNILDSFNTLIKLSLPNMTDPQALHLRRELDSLFLQVLRSSVKLEDLHGTILQVVSDLIRVKE